MPKTTARAEAGFTRTVTATELSNRSGDILLDSERGPVGVLRHGKPRYVIMNIDAFESLRRGADRRRVFETRDAPKGLTDAGLKSMKAHAEGRGDDG